MDKPFQIENLPLGAPTVTVADLLAQGWDYVFSSTTHMYFRRENPAMKGRRIMDGGRQQTPQSINSLENQQSGHNPFGVKK